MVRTIASGRSVTGISVRAMRRTDVGSGGAVEASSPLAPFAWPLAVGLGLALGLGLGGVGLGLARRRG